MLCAGQCITSFQAQLYYIMNLHRGRGQVKMGRDPYREIRFDQVALVGVVWYST